jgi:hypothetical protein
MQRIQKSILVAIAYTGLAMLTPVAAQTPQAKMKDCLLIDDATKERLDCFDAIIRPTPNPNAKKAKNVSECRFLKEEDERLNCFNGFTTPSKRAPMAPKSKAQPKNPQPN